MKNSAYISWMIFILFTSSCAKQSSPLGGPKDEDPPKLLSFNPANESINVKPSTIELEFDEYVKAETPNKQILVTPRINKDEMEVTTNKNRVIIELNQELEDSTTYVFNFQKSIKDVTENNVPENLRLVFSTGPTIDSLQLTGQVSYTFPQKTKNITDVLVGLYAIDDTTNVLTAPPYYVSQTDSAGNFTLQNLKQGKYKAFAWHDSNNSNKAEDKLEPYSFINDTIELNEDTQTLNFLLDKSDLSPFKIQRTSNYGQNFDVTTSKFPVDIKISHEDIGKDLFYHQTEKTIRFYHRTVQNDSIQVRLQLSDSVGFKVDTTMYLNFLASDRKKDIPTPALSTTKNIIDKLEANLIFNKPIWQINFDSLFIQYDTASIIPIDKGLISFKDSLQRTHLLLTVPISDSIKSESFNLYIGDSTFMDIEGVWNDKKIGNTYKKVNPETLAEEIKVTVNTESSPIIVQIFNKKDELIAEQYLETSKTAIFKNIEAGTYIIRAILDQNKNRRWDTSNLTEGRYAEPVYYLVNPEIPEPYDTVIRGGWTLDVTIEPRKAPGILHGNSPQIQESPKNTEK